MDSREYFIYLISCHINTLPPQGEENISWKEIFSLSEQHDMTPVITDEIRLLPREFRPDGNIMSLFETAYENSNSKYFEKLEALSGLVATLSDAKVPHLVVSGTAVNSFYPIPEIRTSGDTNVVLRPSEYFTSIDILRRKGFKVEFFSNNVTYLSYKGEVFEITNELESINIQSKIYFSTPFDDISESNGYTYKLKPAYHLLYLLTHIAHHLQIGGTTVKMINDIDAIIRTYPEIDMQQFVLLCDDIKVKNTALALLALSKKWFNTPLAIDFTFADIGTQELYETLFAAVIEGCVFGSDSAFKYNNRISFIDKIFRFFRNLFRRIFLRKKEKNKAISVRVPGTEYTKYEKNIFEELSIKQRPKR